MVSTSRIVFILIFIQAFCAPSLYSQILSGILLDANTGERLPFGNITVKNSRKGTSTDIEGRFQILVQPADSALIFSYAGYEKREILLHEFTCRQNCTITLKPATLLIGEVQVFPGENPALRIIRQVRANRPQNDPENLESYYYKAYNKFIAAFDTSDLKIIKDSLKPDEVDSFALSVIEVSREQYLLISESVSERRYLRPSKVNETVLASRISGLKNPVFSILATQLQSFTFYRDEFEIFNITLDNPISKRSENQYFFLIEDTLYDRNDADTVFIISYRPRPGQEHKSMKGLLYIATPDFAISNVIASPAKEENFSVSVQQLYEKINGRWFPVQLNSDFKFRNASSDVSFTIYGSMRSYHRDINLTPNLRMRDFRSADLKINSDAGEKDSIYWSQFRVHELTEMENRTYEVIDSLGEVLALDRRITWLTAFIDRKFRIKYVDIELDKILSYNVFEGLRTGIGLSTNERLHPRLTLSGFAGYGWKDRIWKFGYQGSWLVFEPYNLVVGGGYKFDMVEAAQPSFHYSTPRNLLEPAIRRFYITGWDYVSSAYAFVSWEWTPRLKNIIRYNREFRKFNKDYFYFNPEQGIELLTNGIPIHLVEYSMEYAPNDVVTETYLGRRTLRYSYPRYFFNVHHALGSDLGDVRFTKYDVRINHRFGRRRVGFLYTEFAAGHVQGHAPMGYLYAGRANLYSGTNKRLRQFPLADRNSFETMLNNEFLMESFMHLMFRYDTWNLFFDRKPNRPHIEFVYRALVGANAQSQHHFLISNMPPSGLFHEVGIEVNRLLSNLGLAFYYRISPPSLNEFGAQAFWLKVTSK